MISPLNFLSSDRRATAHAVLMGAIGSTPQALMPTAFAFAHRRRLGGPADSGPRGELRAPHLLATRRALSRAAGSTVRDVNTGHRSPYRLPARFCRAHVAGSH